MRLLITILLLTFSILLQGQESRKSGYWSDPLTWGGIIPVKDATVVINKRHTVTIDTSVSLCSLDIPGVLSFDRKKSVTLGSKGNIVVTGKLIAKPYGYAESTIKFLGVNEAEFEGGGMDVKPFDVGLWVRGSGVLELEGSVKTAWLNLAGAAKKGDKTISLNATPRNWQEGDEISIAPTLPPSDPNYLSFEVRKIKSIVRGLVTLDRPLNYSHPALTNPFNSEVYTAEVMNLTRNVKILGKGAHVNIMTSRPSTLSYVEIDSLGAQQKKEYWNEVLGRYPLHFHHCLDGSRGTLVTGVVSKNTGGHGFVPHASHGITFKNCIAYNSFEDAFWWDVPPDRGFDTFNISNHTKFDSCVSAIVRTDPPFRGYRLSNFMLGSGTGNSVTNSIAIGNLGNGSAPGYHWPETSNHYPNVWEFKNNKAHNNRSNAIFGWQNDFHNHIIDSFVGYNNGFAGIEQGAYANGYKYKNTFLFNHKYAVILHANAVARNGTPDEYGYILSFQNIHTTDPLYIPKHRIHSGGLRTAFKNCTFSKVVVDELPRVVAIPPPGLIDFINCKLKPEQFDIISMEQGSSIRVQDREAYEITDKKQIRKIETFLPK